MDARSHYYPSNRAEKYPRHLTVDFRKLKLPTLRKYLDTYELPTRPDSTPIELAVACARHFDNHLDIDEGDTLARFMNAARRIPPPSLAEANTLGKRTSRRTELRNDMVATDDALMMEGDDEGAAGGGGGRGRYEAGGGGRSRGGRWGSGAASAVAASGSGVGDEGGGYGGMDDMGPPAAKRPRQADGYGGAATTLAPSLSGAAAVAAAGTAGGGISTMVAGGGGGGGGRPKATVGGGGGGASADSESDGGADDDDGGEVYCVCREGAYGDMIGCDHEECPYDWFHLDCVGLTTASRPRGKWYCPHCRMYSGPGDTEGDYRRLNPDAPKKRSMPPPSRKAGAGQYVARRPGVGSGRPVAGGAAGAGSVRRPVPGNLPAVAGVKRRMV